MIIGLPTILSSLWAIFKEQLQYAADMLSASKLDENSCVNAIEPWSTIDAVASEDDELELPSAYPNVLRYMEMSVEEATQEYFSQFNEHVCAEFAAATDVEHLLRTIGLRVFVTSNWDGIHGIDPIEFNWRGYA